jgi:hypothetical protein
MDVLLAASAAALLRARNQQRWHAGRLCDAGEDALLRLIGVRVVLVFIWSCTSMGPATALNKIG